jgi:phosphoribosylamine--glycine ligase
MLNRSKLQFEVEPGFAVGIVISTPPFPYDREAVDVPVGIPILFEGNLSPPQRRHVHYGEVGLKHGVLVTSGMCGYTLVVTGAGETIKAARDAANVLADKVVVANARYRRDIGTRLIERDLSKIESWGMLGTN